MTPSLSEGCVAGVMRRQLLGLLPEWGYTIQETAIPKGFVEEADEAFLTNAIHGIRPVTSIGNKKFPQVLTQEIIRLYSASS